MLRVTSFAYKYGVPSGYDLVVDCRDLPNPHNERHLKALTGKDPRVHTFLAKHPLWDKLVGDTYTKMIGGQIKSVAFGCFGGRHRSVAIAQYLAHCLEQFDEEVVVYHSVLDAKQTA